MSDRGYNTHGPKRGGLLVRAPLAKELSPRLTQRGLGRGLLPWVPSDVFIHPTVWHNNWETVPFFLGELGPHQTQSRLGRGFLHTKWNLSPSSRLATTDIGRKLGSVLL